MTKIIKRAASVFVAAAVCTATVVPAVASVSALENVDYSDYSCIDLELNDFEIPALGNGEFKTNSYGNFGYEYDKDKLFSQMSGTATWSYYYMDEFTETFDNLAEYAEKCGKSLGLGYYHDDTFYREGGFDVEVVLGDSNYSQGTVHITPVKSEPFVKEFTVSDCELIEGSYGLSPDFSITTFDGKTYQQGDEVFFNYYGLYCYPLELDCGGKDFSTLPQGVYTVTARVLDAETTFQLTVKPRPEIADIVFEKLEFDELLDRGASLNIKEIRYVDGTSFAPYRSNLDFGWESVSQFLYEPSKMERIEMLLDIEVDSDPWTVGEHPLKITCGSFSKTYTYRVNPSEVLRITVDDLILSEADGSLEWYGVDENTRDTVPLRKPYIKFGGYRPHITIEYRDGTTQEFAERSHYIEEEDNDSFIFDRVFVDDDQCEASPWTVGTHKATARLSGWNANTYTSVEVPFNVIVTESPVESITVSDLTVDHGYPVSYNDYDESVYKIKPAFTAHMKDGETKILQAGENVSWNGSSYGLTTSGTLTPGFDPVDGIITDNIGTHKLYACFMGKITSFKVTVNGVETILFDRVENNGDTMTIDYTACFTDGTDHSGSLTIRVPSTLGVTYVNDETLGRVSMTKDGDYSLCIQGNSVLLETGKTLRLLKAFGDVDGDDTVNILDATLIQKHLAEFTDEYGSLLVDLNRRRQPHRFYAADVNRDGVINISDVTALQIMIAE